MRTVLNVSSDCFYRWLVRPESARSHRSRVLLEKIREVHKSSGYIYGSPRITVELHKTGESISRSSVARLMLCTTKTDNLDRSLQNT
ncbi:IS3 family transposase [Sphingobacterium sp. JB170]|uniref:IS3 family transposase n=1 Tax=Sphingobacterium sp. JB170 TaxID=1434842 RepID=UPI000B353E6A